MDDESCLIDTKILIRWVSRGSPSFEMARSAVKQLVGSGVSPCYTSQNLGEFWNVPTRPQDRNGYGLAPGAADVRAGDVEAAFRLLPDGPAVHQEWPRLLIDYRVFDVQVHDARLVASMHVHGVRRILT